MTTDHRGVPGHPPTLEAEHTAHVDAYTFGWEDDDVLDEVYEALVRRGDLRDPVVTADRELKSIGLTATVPATTPERAHWLVSRALGDVLVRLRLGEAWMPADATKPEVWAPRGGRLLVIA
jgi:hypothetical protein